VSYGGHNSSKNRLLQVLIDFKNNKILLLYQQLKRKLGWFFSFVSIKQQLTTRAWCKAVDTFFIHSHWDKYLDLYGYLIVIGSVAAKLERRQSRRHVIIYSTFSYLE
jgi:hypothetical protein